MRMYYGARSARITGTVKLKNKAKDPFTANRVLDGIAKMDAEIDRLQREDCCRRRGCNLVAEYRGLCEPCYDIGCDES